MKDIIFWGATAQAIVLEDFIREIGYDLKVLFDDNKAVKSPFRNVPLYHGKAGLEEWIRDKNAEEICFLVAIGRENNRARLNVYTFLERMGLKKITAIHPNALISKSSLIASGCQILANSTIGARAEIGKCTIVNTAACIDHECNIGQAVHIAPGCILSGSVKIGDFSFIGSGAILLPRIKVGNNSIVGAGSVVTKDIPANVVAYGNPAKIIKKNI